MPTAVARAVWLIALGLLASCGSCTKKPAGDPAGAGTGFLERSTRLATIPAGYEMGDGRFSADGRQVAYVATKDGSTFVFHGEKRSGPYEDARELTFLQEGRGLAFVARRSGKELAVVGGQEGPALDGIGRLLAAPGGGVVYPAQRAGQWLVVSGKGEVAVPGPSDPSPWVSVASSRVFYVAHDAEKGGFHLRACTLELSGCVAGATYETIESLQADPAGRQLAFLANRDGRATVVRVDPGGPGLQETAGPWYDAVALFALSRGGEHLALLSRRGEEHLLVKDGAEVAHPLAESPLDMVVAASGRALVTAVTQNRVVAFVDGKQLGKEQQGAYFPIWSPDGTTPALVAGDTTNNLVVNGEEGPLFDKVVTPRFTADGARVVYRARKDGKRFVVVADLHGKTLREHPRYEAVFDVSFSPDGKSVGYGVRLGQELWWKVEAL